MATRKGNRQAKPDAADTERAQQPAEDGSTKEQHDTAQGTPRGDAVRAHLGEAGSHLKAAARAAAETLGSAMSEATQAARAELGEGGERIRESLHEAGSAGADALHAGSSPELDKLLSTGRDFSRSAEAMIRARPVAAFGAALAAGYLLARILRR
jgi:ElaB/YqjD/DUF883 family membrane-anchored ribosome-binding protein